VRRVFSLREKPEMGYDHSSDYFFTGNFPVEIADHGEYHFRNLREEPSVVTEEHPQAFRWRSGRWVSETGFWTRSPNWTEQPAGLDYKVTGNYIEGRVNLKQAGLKEDMLTFNYYIHAKTAREDPWAQYDITTSTPLHLVPPTLPPFTPNLENSARLYTALFSPLPSNKEHLESALPSMEEVYFVPEADIEVDGNTLDWAGITPIATEDEWENKAPQIPVDLLELRLAKDEENLYLYVRLKGEVLEIGPNTILELLFFGDMMDDTWQYVLEPRIQDNELKIFIRKIDNQGENLGVDEFRSGSFEYNKKNNFLEIRFSPDALTPYLKNRPYYEGEFRIWNHMEDWIKRTPR
jgi:hypothetical protein